MRWKLLTGLMIGAIFFLVAVTLVFAQESDPLALFEKDYIEVVGISGSGQSRGMAYRAAKVIAMRDLMEVIEGTVIYSITTVKDTMLKEEKISAMVKGVVKGAMECGRKYDPIEKYAEVCMRISKRGLFDKLLPALNEAKLAPPEAPSYKPSPKSGADEKTEKEKEIYDGLIVDVRAFEFKPALVNRILTENQEAVYDPSKRHLGCDLKKEVQTAKDLLLGRGCQKSLFVKAKKVKNFTDVIVNNEDAILIYQSNVKNNFLSETGVVFIVN